MESELPHVMFSDFVGGSPLAYQGGSQGKRRIIMTTALPYANGDIHIGHLYEHFITDFWVRYQKMCGNFCLSICADDTHGTPIMVAAQKQNITPEELIAAVSASHKQDFAAFDVEFDNYSSTHSETNKQLCEYVYSILEELDYLETKTVQQSYCQRCAMFLPDRYVRGDCPQCGAVEQYGDQCESCSSTYNSADLKNGKCVLCGERAITKESSHLFFILPAFEDWLRGWIDYCVADDVGKKLEEWLDAGLKEWCISRDAPYFGFEIPDQPHKYFYVWLDAPLGYLAATKEWCERNDHDFKRLWNDKQTEIHCNIGKDIVYFHALFLPAMLEAVGFNPPSQLCVHGMLTANGEKLSKSRGTFIKAKTYLKHLQPEWLRYYFATKINGNSNDVDFSFADFKARVNSDLIGKITNLASRSAQMLHKHFAGKLGTLDEDGLAMLEKTRIRGGGVAGCYEERDFARAMLIIRAMISDANAYFNSMKPWESVKSAPDDAHCVLTNALNIFRLASIYLKPIIPRYCAKVEQLFNEQPYRWSSAESQLEEHQLNTFVPLATRIEDQALTAMQEQTIAEQRAHV
ncbi:MAG: methionine--tRNA ligase [Pseudomonadota bacterium]|nr:methionine--tRNA ligase [Pseudomonadota bacterium]